MKNGYGHRYRLAPLSFFLSPRLLRKGRGKKHNSAPYIKLLVCFRKWDGDPTTCRWPDVKERTNLGRSSYPTPGHTHTKVCSYSNVMHYKEPLGIIRSIIPSFFFFLLYARPAALIQSMSECLWRIGQEKSGASCGLASNQKRQKRSSLFHRKIFF